MTTTTTTTTAIIINNNRPTSARKLGDLQLSASFRTQVLSTDSRQHKQQHQHRYVSDDDGTKQRNNIHTILKELPISVDSVTDEDITLYAKQLGIDPTSESHLLWIAKRGLLSRLPFPWIAIEDSRGRLYYYNSDTSESSWEHPTDPYYRSLVNQYRLKGSSTTLSMSGLTSLANLHFLDDDDMAFKIESVDFELEVEELLEEIDDEEVVEEEEKEEDINDLFDTDLVTLDITEDGIYDTTKNSHKSKVVDTSDNNNNDNKMQNNKTLSSTDDNKTSLSDNTNNNNISKHQKNIKQQLQSTGSSVMTSNSTVSSDDSQNQKHNEVSINDFVLDVSDDPFAEFDDYDRNYNDLQQTSQQLHKPSHKQLETVEEASEEKDENGLETSSSSSSSVEVEEDIDEVVEEEEEEEEEEEGIDEENNVYANDVQIEHKFEEITTTLTEKITSLRNQLREELTKQKSSLIGEFGNRLDNMDSRVNRNTTEVKTTADDDMTKKIDKELQRLRSDVREDTDELSKQFSRELKQKVGSVVDDIDEKVADFKDETNRELRALRQEMSNVVNNNKNFYQQTNDLKDELSQTLSDIKRHRKEQDQQLEQMDQSLTDETKRFHQEVQRLQTLMKTIETRVQELDSESYEIRILSRLEANEDKNSECMARIDGIDGQIKELTQQMVQAFADESRRQNLNKINDKFVSGSSGGPVMVTMASNDAPKQTNKEIGSKKTTQLNGSVQPSVSPISTQQIPTVVDESVESSGNILNRMTAMEENIRKISDSFERINRNMFQSKQHFNHQKSGRTVGSGGKQQQQQQQQQRNTSSKSRPKKSNRYSSADDEAYDYTSRTSSSTPSLVSSSSISDFRVIRDYDINGRKSTTTMGRHHQQQQQQQLFNTLRRRREVHYSMPNNIGRNNDRDSGDAYGMPTASSLAYRNRDYNYRDQMMSGLQPNRLQHRSSSSGHHLHHHHHQQDRVYNHIRTSSSTLLNLIKKTTKKLRDEAIELESMGGYRFVTDIIAEPSSPTIADPFNSGGKDMMNNHNNNNSDEILIKKLKSVRLDVDHKLRKLTDVINQQKITQI
ncbi:repetitive organellar protein-like [Oppia nitens]|uniref:repetitive organellar protein-like n=1 Tax=Oppia nitens TaxID=1686743 RepID=UPI0023DC00F5|nr:repetitive organellar protein-like [Oppia nitens]